MTTFKEYLTEKYITPPKAKSLAVEEGIEFLNAHCKDGLKAIANGSILYRGFGKVQLKPFTVMDSTEVVRTSKDSNNLYQLMMDTSTAFSGFPKRTNSLICSTSYFKAMSFAGINGVKVVIPADGTVVATVETGDIFNVDIKNSNYYSSIVSSSISNFSEGLAYQLKYFDVRSISKFRDVAAIDEAMSKFSPEEAVKRWFASGKSSFASDRPLPKTKEALEVLAIFKKHPNAKFSAFCSAFVTPEAFGCKIVNFGQKLPQDQETWFSGMTAVIDTKLFKMIVIEMRDRKMPIHRTIREIYL